MLHSQSRSPLSRFSARSPPRLQQAARAFGSENQLRDWLAPEAETYEFEKHPCDRTAVRRLWTSLTQAGSARSTKRRIPDLLTRSTQAAELPQGAKRLYGFACPSDGWRPLN